MPPACHQLDSFIYTSRTDAEFRALAEQFRTLAEWHFTLADRHSSLITRHRTLTSKHRSLISKHRALEKEYGWLLMNETETLLRSGVNSSESLCDGFEMTFACIQRLEGVINKQGTDYIRVGRDGPVCHA